MSTLTFYDAAFPPAFPPTTDGVAFYIGGDTPHMWTPDEVTSQRARYRLPVFVRSDPQNANATSDVTAAVARLHTLGAPKGCLVAWDLETAVDPSYILAVYRQLTSAGYALIVYGSQSTVLKNDNPSGLYWGADWTDVAHFARDNDMTQFISFAAYDKSVALSTLPFWDTRPQVPSPVPVPTPAPSWEDKLMASLPVTSAGSSGPAVKTIQGLCCARGHATAIDGSFGPQTKLAVQAVQRDAKLPADGVVGPKTWPALIVGAS